MNLSELIKDIETKELIGNDSIEISGIAYDSRRAEKGYVFFALRGAKLDGHNFISTALDNGAIAVVCEQVPEDLKNLPITFVVVENSRKALASIVHKFYGEPTKRLRIIGITGTNGKTTTTFLIKSILEAGSEKCGLIGTTGIMIGDEKLDATHTTPESLELCILFDRMIAEGIKTCIMEVSSHSLHQYRVAEIDFDYALFTNLTADHLDYHKDMYEYAMAKKMLFDMLKPEAKAIIFDNSEFSGFMAHDCKADVRYIGRNPGNDFYIVKEQLNLGQSSFVINIQNKEQKEQISLETKLTGRFNIDNAALAASVAFLFGLEKDIIIRALSEANGAPGRMQKLELKSGALALVDYSHTPDALEKALNTCRDILENADLEGKLICVFGCGGDRDKIKRPIMGGLSAEIADLTIITSDNPRTEDPIDIIEQIYSGVIEEYQNKVILKPNREEAISFAVSITEPNDILLVAGKGHETYQIIGNEKHHFDDLEQIELANQKLH